MPRIRTVVVLLVVSLLSLTPLAAPVVRAQSATPLPAAASPVAALPTGATVVASGLVNPRGFVWGQDGTLFVGLAGSGGDTPGPQGSPFFGGKTAGVAAVRNGAVTMLASGLPSTNWRAIDWVWGVNSVAILGDQLYAIVAGGGAVHGNPDTPSGVYTIAADGTATLVADLSDWVDAQPVAQTPPEGAKTNGSFFDVAVVDQALWITDAVNGQVLQVTPAGAITRIADLSKGHPVPSGIVADPQGGADVGFLTPAPYQAGTAKVIHLAADGTVTDVWTGLTTVTGLARGADGALYVAELSSQTTTTAPYLTPNSGQVLRQTGPATGTVVARGLAFPVDLGVGPDDALYVATPAFGADAGTGQILRLSPNSSTGAAGGTPAAAASGASYGAPAASSPSAASGTAVAATIKNFAYQPAAITVAVGTKVTWTNDDRTPHTVTGTDQTVIKSPVLNPGDSYSVTFTKPGSYDYHCEFHANMHGTVVVK